MKETLTSFQVLIKIKKRACGKEKKRGREVEEDNI